MPTRNQHFVPRVYLRRWSPQNTENVFYYKKPNLKIGEPRNVASILFERNTYTISFESYFTLDYMPKVKEDFANQISDILKRYSAVAFYNDNVLNTKELLTDPLNLGKLDEWIFKKADYPDLLASKRKIIANIKDTRSYIIEEAFDDYIEKKWNDLLDDFVSQIEKGYALQIANEDVKVNSETIEKIVATLLLFMCRNPHFDCNGIFPRIETVLLDMLINSAENTNEENEIREFVNGHIRGAWLSQIYKALFNNDISFFSQYFQRIKENCQITIMRCPVENGSFITSDNPAFSFVCYATKANYNAIYFPLTPRYLLLIGKGEKNSLDKIDVKTVTNKGVRQFNKIILSKAYDSIVSTQKYLGAIL